MHRMSLHANGMGCVMKQTLNVHREINCYRFGEVKRPILWPGNVLLNKPDEFLIDISVLV